MKQASDHHHHHSAENYSGSPYRGWIETDRNHYPCEYTTDRSSPSPCSYRVFVPRSSGEDAKKPTASACSLQRRGDPGWEFYRILLNYNNEAAGGSQPRAYERKDYFFPLGLSRAMAESLASGCVLPSLRSYHLISLPGFLPPVSVLQGSACLYWRGSGPPAARKAARTQCLSFQAAMQRCGRSRGCPRASHRGEQPSLSPALRHVCLIPERAADIPLLNRGEGASLCFGRKQEPRQDKLRVKVTVAGGKCAHLAARC